MEVRSSATLPSRPSPRTNNTSTTTTTTASTFVFTTTTTAAATRSTRSILATCASAFAASWVVVIMLLVFSVTCSCCCMVAAAARPPLGSGDMPGGPAPESVSKTKVAVEGEGRKVRLQQQTDELLSQLTDYQTVIPELVDQLGNFLSYDVTYTRANHELRKQSSIRHGSSRISGRHRSKRRAGDSQAAAAGGGGGVFLDGSDQLGRNNVFYKLHADGREFYFNLTLNTALLSNDFSVEYWGNNGSIHRSKDLWDCHYSGFSTGPNHSIAAISNCVGLYGMFSTDVDDYFVEPLWNHTVSTVDRLGGDPHPHIIYSRSSIRNAEFHTHCGVKDYRWRKLQWLKSKLPSRFNEVVKPKRRMRAWQRMMRKRGFGPSLLGNRRHQHQHHNRHRRHHNPKVKVARRRRRPRSVSSERHVETLVVIDHKMADFYQQHHQDLGHPDGLTAYALTIMNIVAKLFHDPSIGNAINIVVTRLIVFTGDSDKSLPQISYHADKSLDSFCRWQNQLSMKSKTRNGRASHDNAVLLTRYDICTYKDEPCGTLGLAPVEGMCEKRRSCSINQDIGLASAYIIAHEIGHNFGMHHDGAGNTCGLPGHEPARIMAARLTKDTSPFQWSSCSRAHITDFLDSGKGWCLDNIPLKREAYPRDVPGDDFSMDTQCKHQFGRLSRACKIKRACRELWCVNESDVCVTNSIPAAEGTECYMSRHKKGWCHMGECRNPQYEARTVHGSWGQWGEWGECSRTCGGGVERSERHCNDPKPQDGGRYCVGLRKRYRSCNVEPCGPNARDFREVQCSSYDDVPFRGRYYKWVPYTGEQEKPCALVCMAEGYNFYTERVSKVIDGTKCYPDKPHICINGECKFVGCDGYLGSRKKEDECRVCDGDSTTCRTVSGFFDKPLPKGAYQEIVTIPRGAIHLQVSEAAFSSNYLALRNIKDQYYINGDWTIDWPRKFPIAGTVFHYRLAEYEPESLQALGPTSEDLVVMMLLQEENRGIQYQYNLPVNSSATSHDISLYTWRHSPWSPCSKTCSTGLSVSKAQCVNKSDDSVVEDTFCWPQPRPSDHNKHCNHLPCPAEWSVGQWSDCSQTCGDGVSTRLVACTQVMDMGESVVQDDSQCRHSNKPATVRDCNLKHCPAIWHTFEWSQCTPSCGPGEKTRRVVCMTSDGSNNYVDEKQCQQSGEVKPVTRQSCINRRCPPPQWRTGEWGQCSVSCGEGKQERTVQCQTFNGQPCEPALKPYSVQKCDSPCKDGEDVDKCEDQIKVAYCPLVFNFGYCSRPYFQTICCETCSKEGTPPPMPTYHRRRKARG